jgi:DNA-binding transcriptional LysR family regulator
VDIQPWASDLFRTLNSEFANDMDTQKLKTFLAVAAGLSFREAARTLNYAPSSVTAQIKTLEAELGARLFDRLGRAVTLTEQGQILLSHARRLLDLEAEARAALLQPDGGAGEISLRASESLGIHCLPEVLGRFRQRFPGTRLTISTSSRHGLVHDLRHGTTDLALILGEPPAAPGLSVEVLGREPLVVVLPPSAAPAGRESVGPEDLDGLPLILTRHVWSLRPIIERALLSAGRPAVGLVECASMEIVTRCVAAGLGVSVVPAFTVAAEVAAGRLATARWRDAELRAAVVLVRDPERQAGAAAEALAGHFREFFSAAGQG